MPRSGRKTHTVGTAPFAVIQSIASIDDCAGSRPAMISPFETHGSKPDYADVPPPETEEMIPVFARLYEACMEHNLPIGVAANIHVSLVMLPEEGRWLVDRPWRFRAKELKLAMLSRLFRAQLHRRLHAADRQRAELKEGQVASA